MNQTKIKPTDVHVQGNHETGEVWLHYRTGETAVLSIELTPEILRDTLVNLALCASQSRRREVMEAVQVLATRELHVGVAAGPLLLLQQELECGLSMSLAFDERDARRLARELEDGIAAVSQNSVSRH